jgi:transketolase
MEAAGLLRAASIQARVVNMHTVKPLDSDTLTQCCNQNVPVFTIEEHGQTGGLGSAIGEWLCEHQVSCRLNLIAASGHFAHRSGSQNFLRAQEGLTAAQVARRVTSVLEAAAC